MNEDRSLSAREAYLTMVEFIRRYAERAPDRDAFLMYNDVAPESAMEPSHDPAMWSDWLDAVRVTVTGPHSDPATNPSEWHIQSSNNE